MSEDPKDVAKKERASLAVERGLRQFLKLETGLGNSPAFQRGYVFAYEWAQWRKDAVNKLMTEGVAFEDAFDRISLLSGLDALP